MKRLLALPFACGAIAAAAAATGGAIAIQVTIAPKKIYEECARLEAGQSRRWSWKSSAPVDFNIHYHRGDDVSYPVKRDGARADGGTFIAATGEDYCWMWTAKDAPARIEGRIEK